MDLQSILVPLQTALVPVVLASTGALLCLTVQTRYGRTVDRIRALTESMQYDKEAERRLEHLYKRARYTKGSLFGLFFAISCFLTLSLVILISMILSATIQLALIVTIFFLGMGSMLIGVGYTVMEIWISFKGLGLEYEIYRKRLKKQH